MSEIEDIEEEGEDRLDQTGEACAIGVPEDQAKQVEEAILWVSQQIR